MPRILLYVVVAASCLWISCSSKPQPPALETASSNAFSSSSAAPPVQTSDSTPSPPEREPPPASPSPSVEDRVEPLARGDFDPVLQDLRAGLRSRAVQRLQRSIQVWTTDAATPPTPQVLARAHYLLGKTLLEDEDPAGLDFMRKATTLPNDDLRLSQRVWVARGALLLAQRDPSARDDALKTFEALSDRDVNDQSDGGYLNIQYAKVLLESKRPDDALRVLSSLFGRRDVGAWALRIAADTVRPTDPDRAKRWERTLLLRHPHEPHATSPEFLARVEDMTPGERFQRAKRLMAAWHYEEARALFRGLVSVRKFAYESRWNIAVISLRKLRDNPDEAEAMLRKVIAADKSKTEDAHYLLMRSFMKREQYDKALQWSKKYDKLFPNGEYRERTAYYRGWLHYDRGDCKKALPGLRAYLRAKHRKRSIVHGFYAWCFIRMEDWKGAVRAFKELIPYGNPLVRGKAHYWRAFAFHKLGQREDALTEIAKLQELYPLSYYGVLGLQLQATIEGRDPRASLIPWPKQAGKAEALHPMTPDMWNLPKLKERMAERFERVQTLVQYDEIDRARALYTPVRDAIENSAPKEDRYAFMRFMSHAIQDFKHPWKTVTGGRLAAMSSMPDPNDVRWLLAYPQAYQSLVEHLTSEYDLPPAFVYSVMRQESRYNPRAISGADAVGALQMIPSTARRVAQDLGITYNPRTFPRPDVGFRYSAFYMHKHAKLWNNQLVLAAASYNGGPSPIARWMRERKGSTLPFLIEEFAYNESRIYCRKVTEHMLRYLYLYEDDPKVRGQWLDALFPIQVNYNVPDDVGY